MLERATETIVQQVEAMKEMVNAFSEYARAPRLEMTVVDLNRVVVEVTDLTVHKARCAVCASGRARSRARFDRGGPGTRPAAAEQPADQCASKRSKDSGRLMPSTTRRATRGDGEVAEITVEDNGPGSSAT
jgi:nitrogen fixation/metabolism regulation signal transduction histidine kinase